MFIDKSKLPGEVYRVDCSSSAPKPVATGLRLQRNSTSDMICVVDGNKELLIAVHRERSEEGKRIGSSVFAYNVQKANQIEWMVKGKLGEMDQVMDAVSITTDECGHVFVCDVNNSCVQVFSNAGIYLGSILKKEEHDLGRPLHIRWCRNTSSFVLLHEKKLMHIAVIKVC